MVATSRYAKINNELSNANDVKEEKVNDIVEKTKLPDISFSDELSKLTSIDHLKLILLTDNLELIKKVADNDYKCCFYQVTYEAGKGDIYKIASARSIIPYSFLSNLNSIDTIKFLIEHTKLLETCDEFKYNSNNINKDKEYKNIEIINCLYNCIKVGKNKIFDYLINIPQIRDSVRATYVTSAVAQDLLSCAIENCNLFIAGNLLEILKGFDINRSYYLLKAMDSSFREVIPILGIENFNIKSLNYFKYEDCTNIYHFLRDYIKLDDNILFALDGNLMSYLVDVNSMNIDEYLDILYISCNKGYYNDVNYMISNRRDFYNLISYNKDITNVFRKMICIAIKKAHGSIIDLLLSKTSIRNEIDHLSCAKYSIGTLKHLHQFYGGNFCLKQLLYKNYVGIDKTPYLSDMIHYILHVHNCDSCNVWESTESERSEKIHTLSMNISNYDSFLRLLKELNIKLSIKELSNIIEPAVRIHRNYILSILKSYFDESITNNVFQIIKYF